MNVPTSLKIGSLNIRSLLPSMQELTNIIFHNSFDIFTVSETWLHIGIPDNLLKVDTYTLYRCDRGSRGGGLCIYLKDTLNASLIPIRKFNNIEQLWIKLKLNIKESLAVGVVYKPPTLGSQLFLEELEDTLGLIFPDVNDIVCTGDFNINVLNLHNTCVNHLFSILETFHLTQIIDTPTRITNSTSSLIDLILVSTAENVLDQGVLENDISDHQTVFCVLKVSSKRNGPRLVTYRNFKNFNFEAFELDLFSIPWYIIFDLNNIDEKLDFLVNNILYLFDLHSPFVTSRCTKTSAPWLTDNIKLMCSMRDRALKRFKRSNNQAHWEFYKAMRNFTTQAIKREKTAYFQYKINNSTPKQCWKFLKQNNLLPENRSKEIPYHLKNVNDLNNFFINSIPDTSASGSVLDFYKNNSLNNSNFKFQPVSESTVLKILNNIRSNATGFDGINVKLLKLCCPHIIPYITHIINFILTENVFPTMWRSAVVSVLPKTSNPEEYKDLRAISVLPTLSKICEKIMEQQLKEWLTQNDLIPSIQSGFRPGHSCTTALLHIVDDVIGATDQGLCTVLILLDFSRAFDTLNYDILDAIFQYIGLSEGTVNLFDSYLRNRKQKVLLDGASSEYVTLKSGVPQGSILGPLLFTIYTSYMVTCLNHCKIHLYADDTQLYYSFPASFADTASVHINDDLNKFIDLAKNHCLLINHKKSKIIIFGPKNQRNNILNTLAIKINNNVLEVVNKAKSLGVIIDNDLRFEDHINMLLRRGYSSLKLIYGNRSCLPQKTKILLCETLVLSHLNYADALYGPCLNSLYSRKIQKLQNSCLRLIYGIRRNQRISHKLKQVKWLNMSNRRLHHTACLFHTLILNKSPVYLYNKITFRTDVHHINVRYKGLLTPPLHHTQLFKRSYSYQIYRIYNSVSVDLKTSNITNFKRKYKKILFDHQSTTL